MMEDVYGQFLSDYFKGRLRGDVLLHNSYGEAEVMPVEAFFRDEEDMPDLEVFALSLCNGRVLDVGAGVGAHSLCLQARGFKVYAVEISRGACNIMQQRGVELVINDDFFNFKDDEKFDTLLLMMNGIGFCGFEDNIKHFLDHASLLIKENGQVLFDSSDVTYLYDEMELSVSDGYYGEIDYQYEYDGVKGEWFSWLYIDRELIKKIAESCGWNFQVIYEDGDDHYLGRLTLSEKDF